MGGLRGGHELRMEGMADFAIRRAAPPDAEAIYHVHKQSVIRLCGAAYSESQISVWSELRKKRDYKRSIKKAHVLVAENEQGVIGFAVLGCRSGELHALYVHPDWTGHVERRDVLRDTRVHCHGTRQLQYTWGDAASLRAHAEDIEQLAGGGRR